MAQISYDPNKSQQQNTTDVLSQPSTQGQQPQQTSTGATEIASTSSTPAPSYVSDGNPYGKYAQPVGSTQPSTRKTSGGGASSGQFTNVQSYLNKNVQSGKQLGEAVSGKLQTTADIARQNLSNVQNKFQQGVQAGGVQDSQQAVSDVQKAAQEASTSQAPTKEYVSKEAYLYAPQTPQKGDQTGGAVQTQPTTQDRFSSILQNQQKTDSQIGTSGYSPEDQALIASNKARVMYGDGSYKDFDTQAEATASMNEYNRLNPGYYKYGDQQQLSVSDKRLADILNAKYTGPTDLSNISGYGKSYNEYQDLSQLQNQALKGGNQGELLSRTFEKPKANYTYGSQLLDQLLLGQGEANQRLQSTAKSLGQSQTGKVLDELKSKVKESATTSRGKAQETEQIKADSRKALSDIFSGKEAEVNSRINEVMQDWEKYPQYFRDRFQGELEKFEGQKAQNTEYNKVIQGLQSRGFDEKSFSDIYNRYQGNQALQNLNVGDYLQSLNAAKSDTTRGKSAYNAFQSNYGNIDKQLTQELTNLGLYKPEVAKPRESVIERQERENRDRNAYANAVSNFIGTLQGGKTTAEQLAKFNEAGVGASFDPNAMNLGLSQLEAQALGIKGGEGLYNLLKEPNGIENLLKTAKADKNKLVGQSEQNQLARLQSIAQLAKDYGATGSGLENVVNKFTERDLAGTQSATDALDTENFKRLMQGAERTFRTDAAGSNIVGTGYGTGSSGGILGSRGAQAWKTLNQNFGDLVQQGGGYRNIYGDEGVNKDLLKQASQAASGKQSASMNYDDAGLTGGLVDTTKAYGDIISKFMTPSSDNKLVNAATNAAMWSNPITAPVAMANMLGSTLGGSKSAAQGQADYNAYQNALANLRQNITNKINQSGLKNQVSVGQNQQQDLELFKLLGLLDQTNL